ncbi:HNH endonuclease [Roseicitreum antarcticum]|uniref:HNH endonuclease n=1 Tax=Roseicitreum antarcticum TaxID=564137 RepID=UPI001CC1C800|nr:HNH endonuclease signature motif containing protein [Roseicitreum antarcticum]
MGRLKQVKPQIPTLSLSVPMARGSVRYDPVDEETRFKKTARWQRLRMTVLERDLFTCQWPGCGVTLADTSKLVADHRVPVRVEPSRKWDLDNLQCLCKACHDGPKQALELLVYGSAVMGRGRGG